MLMLIRTWEHYADGLVYFNTSHVNVNLLCDCRLRFIGLISIHLMLMLILDPCISGSNTGRHFNTSHVNVNHQPS